MAKLACDVFLRDPIQHRDLHFTAGEEPAPEYAALITNPACWEDGVLPDLPPAKNPEPEPDSDPETEPEPDADPDAEPDPEPEPAKEEDPTPEPVAEKPARRTTARKTADTQ